MILVAVRFQRSYGVGGAISRKLMVSENTISRDLEF